MRAFSTLCSKVLGSWKVVESIETDHQFRSLSLQERKRLTIKTARNSLLNDLCYILVLEVNDLDTRIKALGQSEPGWHTVDGVDLLGTLEQGPLNHADLRISGTRFSTLLGKLTPMGPRLKAVSVITGYKYDKTHPQAPTTSPSSTRVSTTAWYEVGRTSERTINVSRRH